MTKLSIPYMSCGHCKAAVETSIKTVDRAAVLDFDMSARTVSVQSAAPLEALLSSLQTAGYPSTVTLAD
jgi:copper chaperone